MSSRAAAPGLDDDLRSSPADARHLLPGPRIDALLAVVADQVARQIRREEAGADALVRKEHRDLATLHGESRRDLRADEAAADDREALALLGQCAEPAVVVERAEIDHLFAAERQAARRPSGSEEQLVEGVARGTVVEHRLGAEVQGRRAAPQVEIHADLAGLAPNTVERLALPQGLRQRGAGVGRIRFGADQPDGARGVELANAADCSVRGHAAAENEVRIVHHGHASWA